MKRKALIFSILMIYVGILSATIEDDESSFRGWAGAAWLHDTIKHYDIEYGTGIACGVALGTSWFHCLTTEVEVLFLHNNISDIKVHSRRTGIHGSIEDFTALFNMAAEFPLRIRKVHFLPYLGGGIGISFVKTKLHASSLPLQSETERRVAYQGLAGISFPVCHSFFWDITVNLEGRYLVFDEHVRAILAIGGVSLRF